MPPYAAQLDEKKPLRGALRRPLPRTAP